MTMTIGERLMALRSRSGMTMSEIARLAGYKGPSSIQRYFAPEYAPDELDYRFALKLVDAMQGAGDPPIDAFEIMVMTAKGAVDSPGAHVARRNDLSSKAFIFAYGTDLVGYEYKGVDGKVIQVEGIRIFKDESYTMFEVPPFLEKRDVYGFIQSGRNMHPRIRDGEVAFTEGRKRAAIGDYVMVTVLENREDQIEEAILGELESRSSDFIELRQPSGLRPLIPVKDVLGVRRIMSSEQLINPRDPDFNDLRIDA